MINFDIYLVATFPSSSQINVRISTQYQDFTLNYYSITVFFY